MKFSPNDLIALLSNETGIKIAEAHVELYQRRLDSGARHVNINQCSQYKNLWSDAVTALRRGQPLHRAAIREFSDYLCSGETEHLTPDEVTKVNQYIAGCDVEDD
jgi:chemotaxis methyl-accepting protein methylase